MYPTSWKISEVNLEKVWVKFDEVTVCYIGFGDVRLDF